jgi:hypothetical protein
MKKKTQPVRVRQLPSIMLKKKTFSRKSRKPPNLCPTHTQRHRKSCEAGLTLNLCFRVGQTRWFFFNTQINCAFSDTYVKPRR